MYLALNFNENSEKKRKYFKTFVSRHHKAHEFVKIIDLIHRGIHRPFEYSSYRAE